MAKGGSALLDVYARSGIEPLSGDGCRLTASDGRTYLDFYGGHAVALLGYGHPRLVKALCDQAGTLFFQSNAVDLAIRERAAARLSGFGPIDDARVFFVNSGAEANENALRIALRATGRPRVVCVAGGFHGRTAAAAAVTDGSERWYGFPQAPFQVTRVPFDDGDALARAVTDDVAAVILEPVQGVAGARAMSREFLDCARQVTRDRGALLILDEVQCGMGRTGHPFAAQAFGITPDILTVAKGLAGGFPAAAVLVGAALAGTVARGDLGTTFGGGPMACALIEAVVDELETGGHLKRVRRLSDRIVNEAPGGVVQAVQGMGFLLGLRTSCPAVQVLGELKTRGILAGGSGDPMVVRLLPPLVLADDDVDALIDALRDISGSLS